MKLFSEKQLARSKTFLKKILPNLDSNSDSNSDEDLDEDVEPYQENEENITTKSNETTTKRTPWTSYKTINTKPQRPGNPACWQGGVDFDMCCDVERAGGFFFRKFKVFGLFLTRYVLVKHYKNHVKFYKFCYKKKARTDTLVVGSGTTIRSGIAVW